MSNIKLYNKFIERLDRLVVLHKRSSQYYDKMNFYIFAPSISLTAVSGIVSFLSTSDNISKNVRSSFSIGVGVIASLSSVLQSFASAMAFQVKGEAHRTAADEYQNLLVRVQFELESPNEDDFVDKLEKSILTIQSKCKYFIPQFIVENYEKTHINSNEYVKIKIDNPLDKKEDDVIRNTFTTKNKAVYELGNQLSDEMNDEIDSLADSQVDSQTDNQKDTNEDTLIKNNENTHLLTNQKKTINI